MVYGKRARSRGAPPPGSTIRCGSPPAVPAPSHIALCLAWCQLKRPPRPRWSTSTSNRNAVGGGVHEYFTFLKVRPLSLGPSCRPSPLGVRTSKSSQGANSAVAKSPTHRTLRVCLGIGGGPSRCVPFEPLLYGCGVAEEASQIGRVPRLRCARAGP